MQDNREGCAIANNKPGQPWAETIGNCLSRTMRQSTQETIIGNIWNIGLLWPKVRSMKWGKMGHQKSGDMFVDDSSCYMTIEFLKAKSQASAHVKAYLTYLQKCRQKLQAIHIDCSKEFINEDLKSWCHQQRIEINQMALYSPSQNRVAEWMNHTLVELVQTMHTATSLPKFL